MPVHREQRLKHFAAALSPGLVTLSAIVGVASATRAAAQLPAAPAAAVPQTDSGLTVASVVNAALTRGADAQRARLNLDLSRGRLAEASGAFATRFDAQLRHARVVDNEFLVDSVPIATPITATSSSYALSMSRRMRSGITVTPTVDVTQSAPNLLLPVPSSAATVAMSVRVPLWRDWAGRLSRGTEQAAEASYDADYALLAHDLASAVLNAVNAYWDFSASLRTVAVYRASEGRAQVMIDQVEALVKADLRPRADLNQLLANLSAKRVTRVMSEQDVVYAQTALGILLGLDASAIRGIPRPSTPFPEVEAFASDSTQIKAWASAALRRRADVEANRRRLRASEALLRASESDAKPDVGLLTTVGYATRFRSNGLRGFVSPLSQHIPGMNVTVALDFGLPIGRSDAQGRVLQQYATWQQQRVTADELSRQVASSVVASATALQAAALALQESGQAVRLQRQAVVDERERYRLGASTVISVVLTEDALTAVELTGVSAQLRYARAIVALRFARGEIDLIDTSRPDVDLQRLLTP